MPLASLTTADGLRLHTRAWEPTGPVRGRLALIHGYAEHSGRYAGLATTLTARGYAVHSYDQRGYGRSEGRRAYVESFDQYLDDLDLFLTHLCQAYPDAPLFLMGHSMGGAVVALFLLERAPERFPLAGVLLSSPAFATDEAPLLQKLSALLGRLVPRLPTIRLDLSALSRDPTVAEAVRDDPFFYHGGMRARTGAELLRAMRRIEAGARRFTLPLLLLHGTADRLTAPRGSRRFYHRIASTDKVLVLFEGFYHETFNEPDRRYVLASVCEWLDDHTAEAPPTSARR